MVNALAVRSRRRADECARLCALYDHFVFLLLAKRQALSLLLIALRRLPKGPPQTIKRRITVYHDNEDFSQITFWAREFAHTVPRVGSFCEEQTPVTQRFSRGYTPKVGKVGGGSEIKTCAIVEDERFPAPSRVPVLGSIEVKDMAAELAPGVAVRRDRATAWRIVPVKEELEGADADEPAKKIPIDFAAKFGDEFLPRCGDVNVVVVLKGEPVMAVFSICPLFSKDGSEQVNIREGRLQTVISVFCEQAVRIDPWKRLLGSERSSINGVEPFPVKVPHRSLMLCYCRYMHLDIPPQKMLTPPRQRVSPPPGTRPSGSWHEVRRAESFTPGIAEGRFTGLR